MTPPLPPPAAPSAAPGSARIRAFDWLRGLAVLVMVQTHAVVLLKPALVDWVYHSWVVRMDGLVAPSFIFTAGFALALVQVRGARGGAVGAQARKSLKRIGEVLAVASLVNLAWFPIWREPKWLLRIDILQCIGLSLLLALPVMVGFAARPRLMRWVMLGLALGIFAVSPLFEGTTGWASLLLNNKPGVLDATTGATFPLLPWAGYVFLGASVGATAALGDGRALWRWLALVWALGVTGWLASDVLRAAYPPHDFWVTNPANAAQRWTFVVSLVALFRVVEERWAGAADTAVVRFLTVFGTSSLSAYFFHEMLLYYRTLGLFSFAMYWRGACDWGLWLVLLVALEALTFACVRGWDRVDPHWRAWAGRGWARLTGGGAKA